MAMLLYFTYSMKLHSLFSTLSLSLYNEIIFHAVLRDMLTTFTYRGYFQGV